MIRVAQSQGGYSPTDFLGIGPGGAQQSTGILRLRCAEQAAAVSLGLMALADLSLAVKAVPLRTDPMEYFAVSKHAAILSFGLPSLFSWSIQENPFPVRMNTTMIRSHTCDTAERYVMTSSDGRMRGLLAFINVPLHPDGETVLADWK